MDVQFTVFDRHDAFTQVSMKVQNLDVVAQVPVAIIQLVDPNGVHGTIKLCLADKAQADLFVPGTAINVTFSKGA